MLNKFTVHSLNLTFHTDKYLQTKLHARGYLSANAMFNQC